MVMVVVMVVVVMMVMMVMMVVVVVVFTLVAEVLLLVCRRVGRLGGVMCCRVVSQTDPAGEDLSTLATFQLFLSLGLVGLVGLGVVLKHRYYISSPLTPEVIGKSGRKSLLSSWEMPSPC